MAVVMTLGKKKQLTAQPPQGGVMSHFSILVRVQPELTDKTFGKIEAWKQISTSRKSSLSKNHLDVTIILYLPPMTELISYF